MPLKKLTTTEKSQIFSGFLTLLDLQDVLHEAEKRKTAAVADATRELAQFKLFFEFLSDEDIATRNRMLSMHFEKLEEVYKEVKSLQIVLNLE